MTATADPRPGQPAWRSLVRLATGRTARVLAIRSLGVAALFGLEITLARCLGVSGYGAFSFAFTIAALVSRLAPLGWLNASTRLLSAYASTGRFGLFKGSLILAYAATAAGLAAAVPLLVLLGPGGGLDWPGGALLYIVPMAAALAVLELHRHILRGLHAGDLGEALLVLLLPALVAGAVWLFAVARPEAAAVVYAAVCLALVLASGVAIARRLPAPVRQARADFRTREWALAAVAILMGSASTELITRTSVLVLGSLGADHEVGLYHAAARLAIMNVFVLRALTPVAAPRFSVLYAAGRLAELREMFRNLCVVSLAGALPFFLLFWLFPGFVLGWFGSGFDEAAPTLQVLSIGYLASAAAGPCATALMMIGRERTYAGLTFAALLASAGANYVLAVRYGAIGAAYATAGVMVLNNALYVVAFLRATAPSRAMSPEDAAAGR